MHLKSWHPLWKYYQSESCFHKSATVPSVQQPTFGTVCTEEKNFLKHPLAWGVKQIRIVKTSQRYYNTRVRKIDWSIGGSNSTLMLPSLRHMTVQCITVSIGKCGNAVCPRGIPGSILVEFCQRSSKKVIRGNCRVHRTYREEGGGDIYGIGKAVRSQRPKEKYRCVSYTTNRLQQRSEVGL